MKYQGNTKTIKPLYPDKTKKLKQIIEAMPMDDFIDAFKVSRKTGEAAYSYYCMEYPETASILCYHGTVFSQLDLKNYDAKMRSYMQKHLRILSAYYGVLTPYTAMTPYRLDFTVKFPLNLYDYWQKEIHEYFHEEELIISLASKEFEKMVPTKNMVVIDLAIEKEDKLTRPSAKIKQARGKMVNEMIKKQVQTLEDIKKLTFDDYQYDPKLSNDKKLVFVSRKEDVIYFK